MTAAPSSTAKRWQLFGIIILSVALGVLFLTAFEKWLRGDSFVVWAILVVVFAFVITLNSRMLLKQMS
jgi:hypothetical protein